MSNTESSVPTMNLHTEALNQAKTLFRSISDVSQLSDQRQGHSQDEYLKELEALSESFKTYGEKQRKELKGVKVHNETKKKLELENQVKDEARKTMEEYVKTHVREELNNSLHAVMPKGPAKQRAETRGLIEQVKVGTANSEARTSNASRNPDEAWVVLKKPDGTDSNVWPANIQTLWTYDSEQLKTLLKDFHLPEDGDRKERVNRFLLYIGVPESHLPV